MPNDYEKSTRTELHRTQEKMNAIEDNLRQQLAESKLKQAESAGKQGSMICDFMLTYLVLFLVFLFWDAIAAKLLIRHSPGISLPQATAIGVCLVQIARYWVKL